METDKTKIINRCGGVRAKSRGFKDAGIDSAANILKSPPCALS